MDASNAQNNTKLTLQEPKSAQSPRGVTPQNHSRKGADEGGRKREEKREKNVFLRTWHVYVPAQTKG